MRAGLNLPQYEIDFAGASSIVDMARTAEEAGFDSVWVSDHPFAVASDGSTSGGLEPLVTMGHILAATERVVVGSLVLAASMRSAEELVGAARALSSVGPGRIVLGLGTGWFAPEHRAYGVYLPTPATRLGVLERAAVAVRETGVPILIGGAGPKLIELAARHADWWNCAWDAPPEVFASLSRVLDDACARAGRRESVPRSVGVTVLLADDRRSAERAAEAVRARAPFLDSLRLEELERAIIVGDPEACARRIAAYGADEVVITPFVRDDPVMVRAIGERVLPLL